MPALSRNFKRELCLFCSQLFSPARGPLHRRQHDHVWREIRVLNLAGKSFRHTVSSGKEPDRRTSTAQEFCRTGQVVSGLVSVAFICYFELNHSETKESNSDQTR